MNNKEIAKMIRECAGNADKMRELADQIDPQPVKPKYVQHFCPGTYVVSEGDYYIAADFEEWKKEMDSCDCGIEIVLDNNFPVFFTETGVPLYSSGVVVAWSPQNDDYLNRDENGNVCPSNFAVKKFQKGKIYMTNGLGMGCPRFFDGKRFFMPGQGSTPTAEMSFKEATQSDLEKYFGESHGKYTAAVLAFMFAEKLK